jgi:patatin-like phospholipase/acyl hydrolase
MIENLYIDGYYHTNDPLITSKLILQLNSFTWIKKGKNFYYTEHTQTDPLMIECVKMLEEKYVKYIMPSHFLTDYCLWNGVDSGTQIWHEDLTEGYHISFLCYMSNMTKETGGAIYFRNLNFKKNYVKIYPKIGDIIIVNHSKNFQHKVENLKISANRYTFHAGFRNHEYIN